MSHDCICVCSGDEKVVAGSSCRCSACLMHGQEKLLDKKRVLSRLKCFCRGALCALLKNN